MKIFIALIASAGKVLRFYLQKSEKTSAVYCALWKLWK